MTGIDSMILILAGIVPTTKAKQQIGELQVRARLLLYQLRDDTVILPMVALSELLVPVPSKSKGELSARLTEKFVCSPFDLQAASIAAELWSRYKKLPQDLQYKSRHVLRADTMIVASAKAGGATTFYSHDTRCRKLANLIMTARDLPKQSDAEDLFVIEDIRSGKL